MKKHLTRGLTYLIAHRLPPRAIATYWDKDRLNSYRELVDTTRPLFPVRGCPDQLREKQEQDKYNPTTVFVINSPRPIQEFSEASSCPSHEAAWGQVPTGNPSTSWPDSLSDSRIGQPTNATELGAASGLKIGPLQAIEKIN